MMRNRFSVISVLAMVVLTSLLGACGKDRWEEYKPYTSHSLWIDSVMRADYLWNDELTDEDELTSSYFLNAVSFLNKVRYSADKVSFVDTAYSEPMIAYGYDLLVTPINDSIYMAIINYVDAASPADQAGLERGEWIMKVDSIYLTSSNQDILSDGEAHRLAIGKYTYKEDEETGDSLATIVFDRFVALPEATGIYPEDLPVVTIVNNQVGYMVYNDIAAENQSKVANASQLLASGGISHMVLDLRYASSGDLTGFQYLASILAPASALGGQLATVQFAESRHLDTHLPFLSANELGNGVNLDLNTIYIITSSSTAGPAEMLINCLKKVMSVVVVGQQTAGIAVACETYQDPTHDQQLRLAVCQVSDAAGQADYAGTGFTPDYTASPIAPIDGILPLGNPAENMLAAALAAMAK